MFLLNFNIYSHTLRGVRTDRNISGIESPGEAATLGPAFMAEEEFVVSRQVPNLHSAERAPYPIFFTQKVKPCGCHIILAYERYRPVIECFKTVGLL
jgi:hypothetical protein